MLNEDKYEKQLQKFISGVECTINVNYDDKASVRKNNKGVDQYRKAAIFINEQLPDRKEDFAELLNHPLNEVKVCCALCIIELMDYSENWRQQALEVIKNDYPNHPMFEKSMINIWLKKQGFDEIEKIRW